MSTVVDQFVIELDDGQQAVIVASEEAGRLLRNRLAEADAVPARVSLRDTDDTEGHALASDSVAISLEIEDDVEGHAFTLRFPTTEAARDFEKRLLATGLLVGVVAAGAVGIGVGQGVHQSTSQGAAAPIVQAAPRDMDKALAPIVQAAPRDMDKELAPVVQAAPRDMDKELAPVVQSISGQRALAE